MMNLDQERELMNYRWELTVKVTNRQLTVEKADELFEERYGIKEEISSRFEHCADFFD